MAGTAFAADGLPQATDLAADAALAAATNIPIMVLYSSPGCAYCERVRTEYLLPMHRDPAFAGRVILREIHIDSDTALTGFDGARTSEAVLARAAGVSLVPTVAFYSPRGEMAAPSIVGLLTADYYYGYLLDAIDAAAQAIRKTRSPEPTP